MPLPLHDDFIAIHLANDFGDSVVALIDGVEVKGLFSRGYNPIDLQGLTIAGAPARLVVESGQLENVASGQPGEGSQVVIGVEQFEINSLQPDGLGLTTIELREV